MSREHFVRILMLYMMGIPANLQWHSTMYSFGDFSVFEDDLNICLLHALIAATFPPTGNFPLKHAFHIT